jgi:hypothetical protein
VADRKLRLQRLAVQSIPADRLASPFTLRAAKALADYSIALEQRISRLARVVRAIQADESATAALGSLQYGDTDTPWEVTQKRRSRA